MMVVGQKDWPLTGDGMLIDALREARVLNRRRETHITILSEEQFLAGLGLEAERESVARLCRINVLAERLDVPADRVRAWVRAGLLHAARPSMVFCGSISGRRRPPARSVT
jgi:hypothetical protein